MNIRECMTSTVVTAHQTETVQHAAQVMRDAQVGFLPVVNLGGAPMGVVTDRDLTIRVIAEGLPLNRPLSDVMSDAIHAVGEDASVEEAVAMMKERNVGRLLVTDGSNRVIGIFSLGDAALALQGQETDPDMMEAIGRHKLTGATLA